MRGGAGVVPGLNRAIGAFSAKGLRIFFTRDWHPPDHISFKSRGGPWPPHCVSGTEGAEFHPDLRVPGDAAIISKGILPGVEAYSGFQGTDLGERLRSASVTDVVLGGLATDYCVKATALDALAAGFRVSILEDCVRAVDAAPGDGAEALTEVERQGGTITTSSAILESLAGTQQ